MLSGVFLFRFNVRVNEMSKMNVVVDAVKVLKLTEAEAQALVAMGLGEKLSNKILLARKRPDQAPFMAELARQELASRPAPAPVVAPPVAPAPPAPVVAPPAPPAQTVYWYCLNGVTQANQLPMADLVKLGASHYHDGNGWIEVKAPKAKAPLVNGVSIPWPRSVKADKAGIDWINLNGVSRFGGVRLDVLQALLGPESQALRDSFLAALATVERVTE